MRKIIEMPGPNLMRHVYPNGRVPNASFAEEPLPVSMPGRAWCIDATLSEGLLTLEPPSPSQAEQLVAQLAQLHHITGLLRKVELRLEGVMGLELARALVAQGPSLPSPPQIVARVPCRLDGVRAAQRAGVKEVGLAIGISDIEIYHGNHLTRTTVAARINAVFDACLEAGLSPRLDLEDVTRCDLEGLLLPLVEQLMNRLSRSGVQPPPLRLCDSLGLGLPWFEVPVPRSIPRMVRTIQANLGLQSGQLELMAADDLGMALANSMAAVLAGCSGVVCSLGGVGQRGGICPTELALVHLCGAYGLDSDLRAVKEAMTLLRPLGLELGNRRALLGSDALVSSGFSDSASATHLADLCSPFDLPTLMNLRPTAVVRASSGAAGIAWLVRENTDHRDVAPEDDAIRRIHAWATERGLSEITWDNIEAQVREELPEPEQVRPPNTNTKDLI